VDAKVVSVPFLGKQQTYQKVVYHIHCGMINSDSFSLPNKGVCIPIILYILGVCYPFFLLYRGKYYADSSDGINLDKFVFFSLAE